ncbi:MAG: response regulator [Chthoniobacterales bacterium]
MNILLVEDHCDTRKVLSGLLQHCGHNPVSANGVAEALDLLARTEVEVLLSDLGLPDGDGLELVAKAKELHPGLIAIALTARGSERDVEQGERAGFDHYLTKPFDFHQLRTILDSSRDSAAS